jgi:NAD-dependent deacetylase
MHAKAVADKIRRSQRVAFFTGAGISAESGLPTYRGVGGLYNDIVVEEGLPIETVLSGAMFARSPDVTWKYIVQIERACRGAVANDAHRAIAALEEFVDVWVITQNVDGFHRDAGSSNVIELHGNLSELVCARCGDRCNVPDYTELKIPPPCEKCVGVMRPNVVLFGELLPTDAVSRYEEVLRHGCDVLFAIGTTAGFPYIYEPVAEAGRRGVTTVEINPDETPLSDLVTHRFASGAGTALKAILNEISEQSRRSNH